MKLPQMKYTDGVRKIKQIKFGGLNHTTGAKDGELFMMRNLSSHHAPVLATRAQRLKFGQIQEPGGLFSWEKLCWVDGTAFYYDGTEKGQVTAGQKSFASIGSWIVILPDKCCYNVDTGEFRNVESKWIGNKLEFRDGTLHGIATKANTIVHPNGRNWAEWFNAGDTVTISGCTDIPVNNRSITIREIEGDLLHFYENSFSLGEEQSNYTEEGTLRIERCMPDIKYICENENRLWGCSENRIFASKLGDPFNWETRDGVGTDGWDVDTGSAGPFTGCISYGGYPVFFKEDHIYKVYGSVPSNFEVMGNATLGLAKGCGRSLAVAGETLFYMSTNGVMAYTGGIPQPIGEVFGLQRFQNAVAGSDGLKYYISMESVDGWNLYVYDTQKGLWHREDELRVTHFVRHDGNLYMLDTDGVIWIGGNPQNPPEDAEQEGPFQWMAEFSDFTEEEPNKKGIAKLQLRLELDAGASAQVWMQFDGDGQWQEVGSVIAEQGKRSDYLPIVPRRADHYRLKLTGTGGCRVYSLARESYIGSENRSRRN